MPVAKDVRSGISIEFSSGITGLALLRMLNAHPEDYILVLNGKPVPVDSELTSDVLLYPVVSGG